VRFIISPNCCNSILTVIFIQSYVTADQAWQQGLVYIQDNKVIMKGDNTSWLSPGQYRNRYVIYRPIVTILNSCSVRISSYAQYNTGLFILDLNRAPWGCGTSCRCGASVMVLTNSCTGVWPAFWTLGSGQWPYVRFVLLDLHGSLISCKF
jgi:hypothetical protein